MDIKVSATTTKQHHHQQQKQNEDYNKQEIFERKNREKTREPNEWL